VTGSLVLAGLTPALSAADRTWNAGGDQYNWSDANNWGGAAPSAGDALFFGGSTGLFNNNDLAANTSFNGVTFNSGADPFSLGGNQIAVSGGVTNNAANTQVFTLNLDNSSFVANAALGALEFQGGVGHGIMTKEGTNTVTLNAFSTDNNSLGATINNGTLIISKAAGSTGYGLGNVTTVNSNGVLRIAEGKNDQLWYGVNVVMNGGTFQMQNPNQFEEFTMLRGSNPYSVVENGLAGTVNEIRVGGGRNRRGIYGGMIRDGAAGVLNLRLWLRNDIQVLNGTNSYTGTTQVDNTDGSPATRLIVNGVHTGGGAYSIFGHASDGTRQASLGGSGVVSASVLDFGNNALLSPGGSVSADDNGATFSETTAILTVSNAVNLNTATSTLDVQLNGNTPGTGYDQVNIAGSGTFSNNSANLKLTLGFSPATGDKFTLVKVPGTDPAANAGQFASLNNVATDLSQGAVFVDSGSGKYFQISYRAEGSTFDAGEGNGNDIMIEVIEPVGGANLTWRGNGTDNNWDVNGTPNWWNGASLVTFTNDDFVTFDDSGTNNTPLNLVGDISPATVLVDAAKDYVFGGGGRLVGSIILTKTNAGTLSIVTDNDTPTGNMLIKQGTVQIGTNGLSGTLSGSVSVSPGGVLAFNRQDDQTLTTAAFSGTGGFVHNGSGQLTLSANMAGSFTGYTTNSGGLLQFGVGSSIAGDIGGVVHVGAGKTVRYFHGSGDNTIQNAFSGSGTVELVNATEGRHDTAKTSVSSNFNGTIDVVQGVLKTFDGNDGYAFGNGSTVNASNYTQVWIDRSATAYNQTFNIAGRRSDDLPGFPAEPILRLFGCTLNGQINLLADSRVGGTISSATILAPIHGSHQLEVLDFDAYPNNSNYQLDMGPSSPHTYSSTWIIAGWIRALNTNAISSGALTLDIAGGLRLNGNHLSVASLSSTNSGLVTGDGSQIQNGHGSTAATLTAGSDNSSTMFDGVFVNGGGGVLGLTKVGSGTLTITALNSNTGPVTVSGGTIALNGAGSFDSASSIIVGSGGTYDVTAAAGTLSRGSGQALRGNGSVSGGVVAAAGSLVHPGLPMGTLSISGSAAINGTYMANLNRTNAPANCSKISASGGLTFSGATLTVTNAGPVLQVGDVFQLFSGATAGITYVPLTDDVVNNVKYTWTDEVATLGRITVASVTPLVNTTPGNLLASKNGSTLSLSWPDHLGWSLQAQTNALGIGLSNNWTTIPGSETVTNMDITINPADPTVFYRLFYSAP